GRGVAAHGGRAVLVRRGVVVWHARNTLTAGGSLLAASQELLAGLESRRATVNVALGPTWSQVKVLEGLPPMRDSRMVTRLLNENTTAFFLRRPQRVAIADAHASSA